MLEAYVYSTQGKGLSASTSLLSMPSLILIQTDKIFWHEFGYFAHVSCSICLISATIVIPVISVPHTILAESVESVGRIRVRGEKVGVSPRVIVNSNICEI